MDLVYRRALGPARNHVVNELAPEARAWLDSVGITIADEAVWLTALTHGSMNDSIDYQRLEFLGDRVLGLVIAEWLYANNSGKEGVLSQRLNALVSRETCAAIAREIGLPQHLRLGKQARDDGAADSDNILCDVIESLLGAHLIEHGFDASRELVLRWWDEQLTGDTGKRKHPKSALQEWAAGSQHRPPRYELVDRSGPDHAAKFTVRVSVHNVGEAEATATSKQEAETAAARAFMEEFG